MTYRVLDDGTHSCSLPEPSSFAANAQVQCERCRKIYWRATRFWTRRAFWSSDWSW